MGEVSIDIIPADHVFGFAEQLVLPDGARVRVTKDVAGVREIFCALDDPAVARGVPPEPGYAERVLIRVIGELGVGGVGRREVKVCDFVVTKPVNVIVVKPHAIGSCEVILREGFTEVGLRSEKTVAADHGTRNVGRPGLIVQRVINELVGKCGIDVLIDNVKDDGDIDGVARIHKAL